MSRYPVETISVINKDSFFDLFESHGFCPHLPDFSQFTSIVEPMSRSSAEERWDIIQVVTAFMLHIDGKYVTHERTSRAPETRLSNQSTLFFGGHVRHTDILQLPLIHHSNKLGWIDFCNRELGEEVRLGHLPEIYPNGYIYDPSTEISKQHVGLVFTVNLHNNDFVVKEKSYTKNVNCMSVLELMSAINEFENWSQLIIKILVDNNELPYIAGHI